MAFVLGTSSGGRFLASQLSVQEVVYSPVYDTPVPTTVLWNLLPDFYRLMDDRDVIESMWTGLALVVSSDLLNLWQVDYAKSLRDVPVYSQRKWTKFDFGASEDFATDPDLTTSGLPDKFLYDSTEKVLTGTWGNRGGLDKAFLDLNGEFTEAASVTWSFRVEVTSIQAGGCMLVGYLNSSSKNALKNALVVGVLGAGSTPGPYPLLMQVSSVGALTYTSGGTVLSVGTVYDFEASYTARTGMLTMNVYGIDAEKLTGTTGVTAEDDDDDTYTSEFVDETADFDDLGILPGDTLEFEGTTYTILTVSGTTLTTSVASMPAGAYGLSYTIRGKDLVSSLSMDLPSEAGDPKFTVDQFGTCTLDTRMTSISDLATPAMLNRKRLAATFSSWAWMDPTTKTTLLKCPRLQDAIVAPTAYLYEGVDYSITDSTFQFQEPPTQSLWAEYAAFDEEYIKDNFGSNVNLEETSSDSYKAKVRGLYYAYYSGPTVKAIRTGVHILVGLPIAAESGTVESVNPDYSGDYGQIVVSGKGYLYPNLTGTSLQVGEAVSMFQPLADGVEVQDYLNSPLWWSTIADPEASGTMKEYLKYHSFAVSLNMDAFDLETLGQAASFVNEVKPTWKDPYFIVYKELTEEVDLDDDLEMTATLVLWDTISGGVLPRYDSEDYEGSAADWRVDQGFDEPDDLDATWTSGAMRATAVPVGVVEVTVGSRTLVGVGTSFLADVGTGLQGDVVDSGVVGVTDAGGTLLTGDPGELFLATIPNEAGAPSKITHVEIAGAGIARVLQVVDDTHLTFSSLTGSDVPFQNLANVVYTVVTASTFIGLGRYFSGTAGTTVDGEQSLTEAGAFADVRVGDEVSLDGDTYDVQGLVSSDEIVLSADTAEHAGDAEWSIISPPLFWAAVVYVTDDEELMLSCLPTSVVLAGTVQFYASLLDNDYFQVHFDQYDEVEPEEELDIHYLLSPTYVGPFPLTIDTATGPQDFTDVSGTPGGELFSVVAERYP